MKKIWLYLFAAFYTAAGINHFVNPEFYFGLIPEYLPWPEAINAISGVAEILIGIGVLIPRIRKFASVMTIIMLISFIPSHWYFVQIGSCVEGGLCTPEWIGWLRLLIIHPILIYWAWYVGYRVD